jgi:hypothetical protein
MNEHENIIETIVPISIDNLKKYFENKNIKFLIDYDNSNLKDEKFLTYVSNLDIPCVIKFDRKNESHKELIKLYMNSKILVNLPVLEVEVLEICLQAFGYDTKVDDESYSYHSFIEENDKTINEWLNILRSMSLYNFYTLTDNEKLKDEFILKQEKKNSEGFGINFVHLLKYEECSLLFTRKSGDEKLYYYEDIFNDYMFNGKNLFHYWQNENNNLFLLTWAVTTGTWEKMVEEGKIMNLPEIISKIKEEKKTGEVNDTPI